MARGLGHVYKRGNIWWLKWFQNGKPCYESSESTVKTDAVNLLKKRLNIPVVVSGKVIMTELFKDLCEYYETHNPKSFPRFCSPVVKYHLEPHFGLWKPSKITTSAINHYIAKRQKDGAANGTINRELELLKRAFSLAKKSTPPKVTDIPRFDMLPEAQPRKGFIEYDVYKQLLDALPDDIRTVLVVGYHTGLRKSKILDLRVDQIDLANKKIYLDPDAASTKNAPPVVPIYGDMFPWLERQVERAGKSSYLFIRANGDRIAELRPAWDVAVDTIGLPDLLFHDLRRSAVRNMVRAGIPEKVAMAISGHKTRSVFERYNIVDERDLDDAGKKMEKFLKGKAK